VIGITAAIAIGGAVTWSWTMAPCKRWFGCARPADGFQFQWR